MAESMVHHTFPMTFPSFSPVVSSPNTPRWASELDPAPHPGPGAPRVGHVQTPELGADLGWILWEFQVQKPWGALRVWLKLMELMELMDEK